jgi:CheY-like chemotaxis protein
VVSRKAPVAVVVIAPARSTAATRALVAELGPPFSRSTIVERARGSAAGIVATAHAAAPSRGVVAIVTSDEHVDAQIAAGVDEVLVEPVDARSLSRALHRAVLRAGVRDDHAIEARTLEQVIEGVAHAAEGPLAALALDLDAMRSDGASIESLEELDAALEDCAGAVDHVARLLRDASVLARVSDDESHAPVVLVTLVDQVLRALVGAAALRAHIEVHSDDDLPTIRAPRRLLARTIAQVLVQALDAVPAEPPPSLRRLRVGIREMPDAVGIVIDARASLDAEPPSTPFTLSTAGRLAVSRAAMRSFDGELIAERAVDGGVRFVVLIPRPKRTVTVVPAPPATEPMATTARPRVLLVDRDPMVLRAATRALSERFDVLVAISGEEALAITREGHIDAVVADVRLPDISGAALIDELRRLHPSLAGRIILACRSREEAASTGALWLEKPIRRGPLLEAIDRILTASSVNALTPIRLLN